MYFIQRRRLKYRRTNASNIDGSFTTAISNSLLSPYEKKT